MPSRRARRCRWRASADSSSSSSEVDRRERIGDGDDLSRLVRDAEIALHRSTQPDPVADGERPVELEVLLHLVDRVRRRPRPEDRRGGVPREGVEQEVGDERDDQQHDQQRHEPAPQPRPVHGRAPIVERVTAPSARLEGDGARREEVARVEAGELVVGDHEERPVRLDQHRLVVAQDLLGTVVALLALRLVVARTVLVEQLCRAPGSSTSCSWWRRRCGTCCRGSCRDHRPSRRSTPWRRRCRRPPTTRRCRCRG